MTKAYTLRVYNSVLQASPPQFQIDVTRAAQDWRRSIRAQGGFWQGSFRLTGDPATLQRYFETWMGYHVEEKAGGATTWEGLIYEMDLRLAGVRRRRSFDLMANRVQTTYKTRDFIGSNLLANPGFETAGGGGAAFASWVQNTGTGGSISQNGATFHGGSFSAQLDGDDDGGEKDVTGNQNTYVRQNISVTEGTNYRLRFWTRGDAGAAGVGHYGRYAVRNPNGSAYWVISPTETNLMSATWLDITRVFVGPPGGEAVIWFLPPCELGRTAYFDDAEVLEEGECVYSTGWAQVEDAGGGGPVARYGLKEERIALDNYPENTSIAYRDTYLAEHAWPWARPVGVEPADSATLEVACCGYIFTANWLYLTVGDGSDANVGVWLKAIVGDNYGIDPKHGGTTASAGDCQFLKAGNIDTTVNTLQVTRLAQEDVRPWDKLKELAGLGDANGNPWQVWADVGRLVHYRQISTTPRYYLRSDGIVTALGARTPASPWQMRPAVVRDMAWRAGATEPGSFLSSPKDIWVEEVEMADGWTQPSLKTALFSEAEFIQAQMEEREERD